MYIHTIFKNKGRAITVRDRPTKGKRRKFSNLKKKNNKKKEKEGPLTKSLAQEVRQKSDNSERRSKDFATCPTVSLCDLSGVILHQK